MFDNICKFLAETFSTDLATWLLGESLELTELKPSELSLEPIRADTLILRQAEAVVLHCEFQTDPDSTMPFRMADYALRVYRRFPQKRLVQVVIYLRPTDSELVKQTTFSANQLRHEFQVIRLWEQPTAVFLASPGLLPYAPLSQTADRPKVLRAVAERIERISDRRQQSNLSAASGILAGLVLDKAVIQRVLRRELMRESVIYQELWEEARQEARQELLPIVREEARQEARQELLPIVREEARQELLPIVRAEVQTESEGRGRQDEARSLLLLLLTQKFGSLPDRTTERISRLTLEQLEALALALLQFSTLTDLENWLSQ